MNENNKSLESIINAVGCMTEILWLFYSGLVKQGFSKEEAMNLTESYLTFLMVK